MSFVREWHSTARLSPLHRTMLVTLLRTSPGSRCGTELLLERTRKCRFRLVSDLFGDPNQRIVGGLQFLPSDQQAPVGEVVHWRQADHAGESFGEAGAG